MRNVRDKRSTVISNRSPGLLFFDTPGWDLYYRKYDILDIAEIPQSLKKRKTAEAAEEKRRKLEDKEHAKQRVIEEKKVRGRNFFSDKYE